MIIVLNEPEDIYKIWQMCLEVWFITNIRVRSTCGHGFVALPCYVLALHLLLERGEKLFSRHFPQSCASQSLLYGPSHHSH